VTEQLTEKGALGTLDRWTAQVKHNAEVLKDHFPHIYNPQREEWITDGGWTEGFWTGILWWLTVYSRDAKIESWARHYTRLLAEQKEDISDHDLGFLFYHSCVMEYLVTGNTEMAAAAHSAAERLSDRYNPKGSYIRAHGELSDPERAGYAIIDTIMNLRLLFWAYRFTGEESFYDIARNTAETIAREYIRDDGSSYQVVWFDSETGEVVKKDTLQGYDADSCWSRGQAWGIYGFAQAYKHTGDLQLKRQAARLAKFFVSRLPEDGVVFYDFDDPNHPFVPKDTSAQAIAAAGLFALSEVSVGTERRYYFDQGVKLLSPLFSSYLVLQNGDIRSRGLLREACHFKAENQGVDSEIVYGDYYMIEALMRYLSITAW
jgi:unsaturated chondroitin disaccharide hydrolase